MKQESSSLTSSKLTRRRFLDSSTRSLAGVSAGLFLSGVLSCGRQNGDDTANERPNIVIIVADDAGWADVGYHGSEIKTPTIDRLVRGGIELDQGDLETQIRERDEADEKREMAPLRIAPDAHVLDTSRLTIDEVVQEILTQLPHDRR